LDDNALQQIAIAGLSKLKSLHLGSYNDTTFSDNGLTELFKSTPKINNLSLYNNPRIFAASKDKHNSHSRAWLKHLSELQILVIEMAKITNEQVVEIFECCQKLTSLTLGYCDAITTSGLLEGIKLLPEAPAGHGGFNYLDIYSCSQISDDDYAKLQKLPQLSSAELVYILKTQV